MLLATEDGGRSWQARTAPSGMKVRGLLPDGGTLWATGFVEEQRLFVCYCPWLPHPHELAEWRTFPLGLLAASDDGGRSWRQTWGMTASGALSEPRAVAAGAGGPILAGVVPGYVWYEYPVSQWCWLECVDHAHTWHLTGSGWTDALHPAGSDISLVGRAAGWAVWSQTPGEVRRTTDGGATWASQWLPIDEACTAVVAVEADHGVAATRPVRLPSQPETSPAGRSSCAPSMGARRGSWNWCAPTSAPKNRSCATSPPWTGRTRWRSATRASSCATTPRPT